MNIAGTYFNLNHRALEVYLSGCKEPHCPGCHNSELWDFNVGEKLGGFKFDKLVEKLHTSECMIDHLWIMGGEPLHQDHETLENLLFLLKGVISQKIWIWTKYTIIPDKITQYIDYVKFGEYNEGLEAYTEPLFNIKLASNNQVIVKL